VIIATLAHFLHRLTTKIRRLGYEKKHARFLAGALVVLMVDVAILLNGVRVVQDAPFGPMTGDSTGYCGQIAAESYYAPFGIHR
jgi:hypothetical protein